MFLRRLFYDGETGDVLYAYEMQGGFTPVDAEKDPNRPMGENVRHMDWLAPDPAVETKFSEYRTLCVDTQTGALIWGEPGSAAPPPPDPDEIDALLDELEEAIGE